MSWLTAAAVGAQIFQGFRGAQKAKSAGKAAYEQGMWNAQQAEYFGRLNAGAIQAAAGHNASMVMQIGELNAQYIEKAGERNLKMYGIQSAEEMRRHVMAEKYNAGAIRAMQASTGAQVNTGSNLMYLNDQINEGLNQRHFLAVKHAETKKSIRMDFEDKAYVTRETARLQAATIAANGAIGAEMALAEAKYKSDQYAMNAQYARDQGKSDMLDSILGAGIGITGTIAQSDWGQDFFSNLFKPKATAAPQMISSLPSTPTYLTAPGHGAPRAYGTPVYTHRWASDFLTGVM